MNAYALTKQHNFVPWMHTWSEYAAFLLPHYLAAKAEFDGLSAKCGFEDRKLVDRRTADERERCDDLGRQLQWINEDEIREVMATSDDLSVVVNKIFRRHGVNSPLCRWWSAVEYAILDPENAVPDFNLNLPYPVFESAREARARRQAVIDARIPWEDAPKDVTADTVEWEPMERLGGRGFSETQRCRAWVNGLYIVWTTYFPSPYARVAARIDLKNAKKPKDREAAQAVIDDLESDNDTFQVYVGQAAVDAGCGELLEGTEEDGTTPEFHVRFKSAEDAVTWCLANETARKWDFEPLEAPRVLVSAVGPTGERKVVRS